MKRQRYPITAAALLCVASGAVASPASAKTRVVELSVTHSAVGRRAMVPVVRVVFVNGEWRLASGKVRFDLRIRAKVNAGKRIHRITLFVPETSTGGHGEWRVFFVEGSDAKRKVDVPRFVKLMRSRDLGAMGRKAVDQCKALAPDGTGSFRRRSVILVGIELRTSGRGWNVATLRTQRGISFDTFCEGNPAEPRSAAAPRRTSPPFRVTGGGVTLKALGSRCPRTVFATATVFANKPGKVRYVLRSSLGRKWTQTVFFNTRDGRGRYRTSYDHRFVVARSTSEKFWIEVGGRKLGRSTGLKVVCRSDRPNSMSN